MLGCLGWLFTGADESEFQLDLHQAAPSNPLPVFLTVSADLKVSLWMIIATIPKAGVSCAQSMLLACMNELVPANKKQLFVFSVVTWARVWLLSAPFFNVLKKIDTALSLTSYSVFSILGGICTCLLLTPRSSTAPVVANSLEQHQQQDKKEQSPLNAAVWTVESDEHNTRL